MANSINTNVGALAALSALRVSQAALDVATKQVQTGYRFADAEDDASSFSVAQGIRGDLQAYQAVQGSLASGVALGSITQIALTHISDLVSTAQAKVTQLADGSISDAQRAIYSNDFYELATRVKVFINQASYNGRNLIGDLAVPRSFLADTSGTKLTLSAHEDIFIQFGIFQGNVNLTSASEATDSLQYVTSYRELVDSALATVVAETRALRLQSGFIDSLVDATTVGLGALVDADIGKAAASVQALQVRRQIGIQSLSIANRQPSVLLDLLH